MTGPAPRQASNPILPGCYPDPSICRVGEDFYLVTSTFEYFPGLPIFHSTDLIEWAQIGHVITEPEQLNYAGIRSSGGLYAPTLRHDGENFWIVCTLVAHEGEHPGGNFVMTAPEITGPWSEPTWLNTDGIDPSVFFDDDGRIWMHGTRLAPAPQWPSQTEIWLREYSPQAEALVGEEHVLWRGAVQGAVWSEAPHIYKINGTYYLLTAEGGTDFHHAVSIARAPEVTGPYTGAPTNPIFTHRHLGREYPVVGAGHADLVQASNGSWWAVLLAMRTSGGYHYNLGRETFLVPVAWEEGWPVFAPGVGRLTDRVEVPAFDRLDRTDRVKSPPDLVGIPPEWTTVRGPLDFVAPRSDGWDIEMRPTTLYERGRPALVAVRQPAFNMNFGARLRCELAPGEEAGVVVRQSEEDHVRCAVVRDARSGEWVVRAIHRKNGADQTLMSETIAGASVFDFEISARGQEYRVLACAADGADADEPTPNAESRAARAKIAVDFDGRQLDSVTTGGFLGLWLGVYASSNGAPTSTLVTLERLNVTGHE